jgi:xanthine dehydrogenase accessory factor
MLDFWVNILEKLQNRKAVVLLYVVASEGSSPGRAGFRMMIAEDGDMRGSIGGGIMEHKLIEFAAGAMQQGRFEPFLKEQIHQSDIPKNRSGMICSGRQTIAFYYLDALEKLIMEKIVTSLKDNQSIALVLNQNNLNVFNLKEFSEMTFERPSSSEWVFRQKIGFKDSIYIVGAGHVSLALSEVMNRLGFFVEVIDDRAELNTFVNNRYAHKKTCIPFDTLGDYIPENHSTYIAVMTFGYRSDEVCVKQLIGGDYAYLGVMGSHEKMRQMLASLVDQGYAASQLDQLHTPIGLKIKSKTPMEIAVSVAAEIILVKNKGISPS